MVIYDFDIKSFTVTELKADSPLIVDSDRVLTFSVTFQFFQAIGGGESQIIKGRS
jgi:hypothetical protein